MKDFGSILRERDRADAIRGYSIGGFGGGPISFLNRGPERPTITRTGNAQVLEGFAVLYDKAHSHKGSVDVFRKGCFDRTLSTKTLVQFFIDHKHDSECLGDTDTNLELVDSDVGLGFRLKLTDDILTRLEGREQMSVCYHENDVEARTIEGQNVRLIKSAVLVEISAVHHPAVKQTYAVIRDTDKILRLSDDVRTKFPNDSAAAAFTRALYRLQTKQ